MDCKNYGRFGSKPELCPTCEYSNYCKDAKDPTPINSCEYDDGRSNTLTEAEAKDNLPAEPQYYISPADFKQVLFSILSISAKSKKQFHILTTWILEFGGTNGKGRDGLIKGLAESTGYSARTIQRHVQCIADDPVLGQVFIYHNRRVGNRKIDKGNGKMLRKTSWAQMEMIFRK